MTHKLGVGGIHEDEISPITAGSHFDIFSNEIIETNMQSGDYLI